jgi:hypothetical protein
VVKDFGVFDGEIDGDGIAEVAADDLGAGGCDLISFCGGARESADLRAFGEQAAGERAA